MSPIFEEALEKLHGEAMNREIRESRWRLRHMALPQNVTRIAASIRGICFGTLRRSSSLAPIPCDH